MSPKEFKSIFLTVSEDVLKDPDNWELNDLGDLETQTKAIDKFLQSHEGQDDHWKTYNDINGTLTKAEENVIDFFLNQYDNHMESMQ